MMKPEAKSIRQENGSNDRTSARHITIGAMCLFAIITVSCTKPSVREAVTRPTTIESSSQEEARQVELRTEEPTLIDYQKILNKPRAEVEGYLDRKLVKTKDGDYSCKKEYGTITLGFDRKGVASLELLFDGVVSDYRAVLHSAGIIGSKNPVTMNENSFIWNPNFGNNVIESKGFWNVNVMTPEGNYRKKWILLIIRDE